MNLERNAAALGAIMWIASDSLELLTGGYSAASLWITLGAFAALAVGVWGLRGSKEPTRSWQIFTGCGSLGFALMAAVAAQMIATGAELHPESALFVSAVLVFSVGLLGIGIVSLVQKRHHPALGALFLVASVLSLLGEGAEVVALAVFGHVLLSAVFIVMAFAGRVGQKPSVQQAV